MFDWLTDWNVDDIGEIVEQGAELYNKVDNIRDDLKDEEKATQTVTTPAPVVNTSGVGFSNTQLAIGGVVLLVGTIVLVKVLD